MKLRSQSALFSLDITHLSRQYVFLLSLKPPKLHPVLDRMRVDEST